MTPVSLDDIISSSFPEVVELLKKDFRKELDSRITILDLSYEALKVNVYRNTKQHIDAYNYAYSALERALNRIAKRKFSSLEELPVGYFSKKNAGYVYIDGGPSNRFIVANSFGAIDTVVRELSRDEEVSKTSFGTTTILTPKKDKKGRIIPDDYSKDVRRKVDIGHISTEGSENLTSPLEEKLLAVMQYGTTANNKYIENVAKKALDELYSIQVDASYSFKNTSPEAIALAKSKLGEGYVVVTLHRQKLNNKFSQQEAQIFFKLKSAIAKIVSKQPYSLLSGSNNIVQDIGELLLNAIDPKNKKKPKKHVTRSKTTKKVNIPSNNLVKGRSVKVKKQESSIPNTLASLEALLSSMLVQRIKENMGDGSRRDILNLQSGRFAESAKVERLSQSREGMITVFYNYMKNPYATFSRGGRQERPYTRDPKLLISKSIREIASQQVANRLRAVSV